MSAYTDAVSDMHAVLFSDSGVSEAATFTPQMGSAMTTHAIEHGDYDFAPSELPVQVGEEGVSFWLPLVDVSTPKRGDALTVDGVDYIVEEEIARDRYAVRVSVREA